MNPLKLKMVQLHNFNIENLFKSGEHHYKTVTKLPDDISVVRMVPTIWGVDIVFQSEEFPEIKEGSVIPRLDIEFEKLYCGENK